MNKEIKKSGPQKSGFSGLHKEIEVGGLTFYEPINPPPTNDKKTILELRLQIIHLQEQVQKLQTNLVNQIDKNKDQKSKLRDKTKTNLQLKIENNKNNQLIKEILQNLLDEGYPAEPEGGLSELSRVIKLIVGQDKEANWHGGVPIDALIFQYEEEAKRAAVDIKALRKELKEKDWVINFMNDLIIDTRKHAESLGCKKTLCDVRKMDINRIKQFMAEQATELKTINNYVRSIKIKTPYPPRPTEKSTTMEVIKRIVKELEYTQSELEEALEENNKLKNDCHIWQVEFRCSNETANKQKQQINDLKWRYDMANAKSEALSAIIEKTIKGRPIVVPNVHQGKKESSE